MELSKKSELNLGTSVYVVSTELTGEAMPSIETRVVGRDGALVFETSQDISGLRPIFQNSEEVFARLEKQHVNVVKELEEGRIADATKGASDGPADPVGKDSESELLDNALGLLSALNYTDAASALRDLLATSPNCSEARELLEVAYKASSDTRPPIELSAAVKKGVEAFTSGRQREAIEHWKQCLVEEPHNRRLQLLVLLSTTWSSQRRRDYTREVLAQDHLHSGRPEEGQALLLLAQTAEDASTPTVSMPEPPRPGKTETETETETENANANEDEGPGTLDDDDRTFFQSPTDDEEEEQEQDQTVLQPAPDEEPGAGVAPLAADGADDSDETAVMAPTQEPDEEESFSMLDDETLMQDLESPGEPSPSPIENDATVLDPKPLPPEEKAPVKSTTPLAEPEPPAAEPQRQPAPPAATPTPATKNETEAGTARKNETPAPAPDPAPEPTGTGTAAAAAAVPTEAAGEAQAQPQPDESRASSSSVGETRPGARRPRPPAKSSPPLAVFGAIAAVVVVALIVGIVLMWPSADVPSARLDEADGYVRAGQYSSAINAYNAILDDFGDHAEVFLGRGRARIAASDTQQGLADLANALEMSGDPSIAEEIGDVYYSTNRFPQAIEHYAKAFDNAGGSTEARYRMAVSLVQQQRGDEALEHLQAGLAGDSGHNEAQFLYGQLLNERGRFSEAEQAFRAAESSVGNSSDFLTEMGVALLEQSKLDEAEEVARAFRLAYPSDPRSHSLLGEIYLNRGQYEPARAQLIQALRTDRNEPRAQIALGRTWLAIGVARGDASDLAKARQVLSAAQGVDEAKRLLALGQVAVAQGDYEAAELWLREALGRGASGLAAHLALAEARARSDDLAGAAEELQRASAFASDDPAIALSLAVLYSQLNEPDRTMASYLEAVRSAGLVAPASNEDGGPVLLPNPYVPLPNRFDINRSIRASYESVLRERPDDPAAVELKRLAESVSFVLGRS